MVKPILLCCLNSNRCSRHGVRTSSAPPCLCASVVILLRIAHWADCIPQLYSPSICQPAQSTTRPFSTKSAAKVRRWSSCTAFRSIPACGKGSLLISPRDIASSHPICAALENHRRPRRFRWTRWRMIFTPCSRNWMRCRAFWPASRWAATSPSAMSFDTQAIFAA